VSGDELGANSDVVVVEHQGRELRFCNRACAERFQGDAEGYFEKVDAAIVADQLPLYPLEKCTISEGPLDGMGEPYDMVIAGRLIRLCCGSCVDGVNSDPTAALTKLAAAEGTQAIAPSTREEPISGFIVFALLIRPQRVN
jgi:YHS domain-containing protein